MIPKFVEVETRPGFSHRRGHPSDPRKRRLIFGKHIFGYTASQYAAARAGLYCQMVFSLDQRCVPNFFQRPRAQRWLFEPRLGRLTDAPGFPEIGLGPLVENSIDGGLRAPHPPKPISGSPKRPPYGSLTYKPIPAHTIAFSPTAEQNIKRVVLQRRERGRYYGNSNK